MVSQQPLPFRQRLIDSAVGLARSTAANTPGALQDEISSLRTFQKTGLQTRRRGGSFSSYQNSGVKKSSSSSKQKSPRALAESSFRSQCGVNAASDQVAADFDSFYNAAPGDTGEHSWISHFPNNITNEEHITSLPRNESRLASGPELNEISHDLGKTNEQMESSDVLLSSQSVTSSSRANARLDQLLQHLGPAEIAVCENTRLGDRPTALQQRHEHASIQQSHMGHHPLHPLDQEPIPRNEMRDDADQADEEEEEQLDRTFHCPYVQCHQHLRAERLGMGGTQQRARECVHAGCEYNAQGTEEWMRHILLPHHDLQALVQ